MNQIHEENVREEFNRRAVVFKDNNAVLDASADDESVRFSNIYRDYITKKGVLKTMRLKPTDHVLDFGCGVGRITKLLSKKVQSIVGVDISDKMIEIAQEKNSGANITYQCIAQNNISHISEKPFDSIFSYWVMQHIAMTSIDSLAKDFNKMLQPHGRIYIYEQIKGNVSVVDPIHEMRTVEDYNNVFLQNGFEFISSESTFRMPSFGLSLFRKIGINNPLILWLCGWVEFLTVNRKPEFIDYHTACIIYQKK